MSSKKQIGRQQVAPAAFEIRFSTTDSQEVECFPIQPNVDSQVPDPFKKRDKIRRSSSSSLASEHAASNNASSRLSGTDHQPSPTVHKPKHTGDSLNGSQKRMFKDSNNGIDAFTKGKSWNAIGPDTEKQERVIAGKHMFAEKGAAVDNDNPVMSASSTMDDNSVTLHVQLGKKRTLPVNEIGSEKDVSTGISRDLKGTSEMAMPLINKISTQKTNHKNKKINTTINRTIVKSQSIDGIMVTPPATPPRSPTFPTTPQSKSDTISKDVPNISLPSPPPSAGSVVAESISIATPTQDISPTSTTKIPRPSPSRPILTAYLPEPQEQEIETPNLLQPKKPTISHDDMIIPTLAKKLKMNGQLPYDNHEALLPYGSSFLEFESTDITGLVEDLPSNKPKKNVPSTPNQRNRRSSLPSKSTRVQNKSYQSSLPTRKNSKASSRPRVHINEASVIVDASPIEDKMKKDRRSKREEYIMVIKDDDEEFDDVSGLYNSTPMTHSEPSISVSPTLYSLDQGSAENEESKIADVNGEIIYPSTTQDGKYNPITMVHPEEEFIYVPFTELENTLTSRSNIDKKQKKDKKKKAKNKKSDGYTKKSTCCCVIC